MTNERGGDDAVSGTVQELGRLDILINMASLYQPRPFNELTVADWDRSINVDLRAAFLCAHAAVPHGPLPVTEQVEEP